MDAGVTGSLFLITAEGGSLGRRERSLQVEKSHDEMFLHLAYFSERVAAYVHLIVPRGKI